MPHTPLENLMPEGVRSARDGAADLADHPWVERFARIGFAASGLVHLLMGWITVRVATADQSTAADQSGAFAVLADNTAGRVLLWVAVAGFAGLALLLLLTAALPYVPAKDRAKDLGKGLTYAALTVGAFGFARGQGNSSSEQTRDLTGPVLSAPGGQFAIGALGLAIAGIGAYHVVKGVTRKFRDDLAANPGTPIEAAGVAGYFGKGIALTTVGVLFVLGAAQHDPDKTGGLDTALRTLLSQPAGTILVMAIGVGLACFGVYSFGRARYARL